MTRIRYWHTPPAGAPVGMSQAIDYKETELHGISGIIKGFFIAIFYDRIEVIE